jgi:hypothetical protein
MPPDEEDQGDQKVPPAADAKHAKQQATKEHSGVQVLAEIAREPDIPPSSSDESDNDEQGFLHRDDYWEEEEEGMRRLVAGVMAANRFSHLIHSGEILYNTRKSSCAHLTLVDTCAGMHYQHPTTHGSHAKVAEEPSVKSEHFGGDQLPADVASRALEAVLSKVMRWAAGGFGAKPIAHSHVDLNRVSGGKRIPTQCSRPTRLAFNL